MILTKAYLGSTEIQKAYLGANLVFDNTVANPIPLANIISEYKFEDNVLDTVGANNGTATDITYAAGLVGQSGVFNGSTSQVDCGNDISLKISSGSITLLIKTSASVAGYKALVVKSDAYGLFTYNNNLATYDFKLLLVKDTGININNGAWRHITLTFNSGVTNGTHVYLDGLLILTTTITIKNQLFDFQIGANTTVQNINASVDCVRVWDKELTQTEITAIATAELAGTDINP